MATMVVIKCPEIDREVATGLISDLMRFSRLGDGQRRRTARIAISSISGRSGMPFCQLRSSLRNHSNSSKGQRAQIGGQMDTSA